MAEVAEVAVDPAEATRGAGAGMIGTEAVLAAGGHVHHRATVIEASVVDVEGRAAVADGHEMYMFPVGARLVVAAGGGAMTGAAGLRLDLAPDPDLCPVDRLHHGLFRALRVLMEVDGPAILPAPHDDDAHDLDPAPRCLGATHQSGAGLAAVPVQCHRIVALPCPSAVVTRHPEAGVAVGA